MKPFYYVGYSEFALGTREIFLTTHIAAKKKFGLQGYCESLISAVDKASLPLKIDRTKVFDILSAKLRENPNEDKIFINADEVLK